MVTHPSFTCLISSKINDFIFYHRTTHRFSTLIKSGLISLFLLIIDKVPVGFACSSLPGGKTCKTLLIS